MARLRLSDATLAGMGFSRVDLGEGLFYMMHNLKGGRTLEYVDGKVELAHEGYSVPLRCEGREHLEQLIKYL